MAFRMPPIWRPAASIVGGRHTLLLGRPVGTSLRAATSTSYLLPPPTSARVPRLYAAPAGDLPHDAPAVLRWLAQKDALVQDAFLVGPPGPERRRLALAYAEGAGRGVEAVALSRDTTDADLRQRREIVDGSAVYVDAAPVRAAMSGAALCGM
jgi:hypothetical protein